jgi:hypothetical protein
LVWIIFLLGIVLSLSYMLTEIHLYDSQQVLDRAFLFTKGYLVPFGSISTNNNFLYGSFLSIYCGFFLFIFQNTFGVLIGIGMFHAIGFWALLKTQFLRENKLFFLSFLFLFWCSPWRANEVFVWNAAFLFTISAFYLLSLDLFLRHKQFSGTLIQGLSVIVCFQVHNSFFYLVVLSLLLWWKGPIKPNWTAFFICLLVFITSLLPTLYVIHQHPEIMEVHRSGDSYLFRNLIHIGEGIKGLLYWFRYPSLYFGSTTFNTLPFTSSALTWLWTATRWAGVGISVLFVLFSNITFFKEKNDYSFIHKLTTYSFISLLITTFISPASFNYWHLYLIYPFAIMPVATQLSKYKNLSRIIIPLGIYFFVFVLISSYGSAEHSINGNLSSEYQHNVENSPERIIKEYEKMSFKFW